MTKQTKKTTTKVVKKATPVSKMEPTDTSPKEGLLPFTTQEVETVSFDGDEYEEIVQRPLGRRTPIHAQKATGIKTRPGYTARQIVEKPGRVQMFLDAGYTIIPADRLENDGRIQTARGKGSVSREVVNKHRLAPGDTPTAIWMEIPDELYEQDQQEKLRRAQEQENQIDPRRLAQDRPDVYYGATYKKTFDDY